MTSGTVVWSRGSISRKALMSPALILSDLKTFHYHAIDDYNTMLHICKHHAA